MSDTVFFSWQSDRPAKVTRSIVRSAIEAAILELNAEIAEADRPSDEKLEIDHDTKGLPGSPDIAAAILAKIEAASVFVADVTPIGLSDSERPKHLPNPNVLIELGYAKKALTTDRIVQVWNTAFTRCGPEDLPFDMRGKRGPIEFMLSVDADKSERDKVTKALTRAFLTAFKPIIELGRFPSINIERWAASDPADNSIWPTEAGKILINEPEHGSGLKRIFPAPRSFVRIIPARWSGSDDLDRHDTLLEMQGGFSWGGTSGGVVTYPGSVLFADTEKVHAITKRFEGTGEVWATRTDIVSRIGDYLCVRGDAVPRGWIKYLAYALPHMKQGGAEFPFVIRLGVVGLAGYHWPNMSDREKPHAALQPSFIADFTVQSGSLEEIWEGLSSAWIGYRKIFSLPYPSHSDQQSLKLMLNHVIGQSLEKPGGTQ